MPLHAARLAAVQAGLVGRVGQVHVSSTQLYHAVSLLRRFLGVGLEGRWYGRTASSLRWSTPSTVAAGPATSSRTMPRRRSRRSTSARDAAGCTTSATTRPATCSGPGACSCAAATASCPTRPSSASSDATTITHSSFSRRQTGHDLDQNGYATDHIALGDQVYWRNPWPGQRWTDDELAIAELLTRMAAWVHGEGPDPYPLVEACADQLLALAITESAETDRAVRVDPAAVLA